MIFTDYNGYALEKSIAYVIDRMRNSGNQFATASFTSNDNWYLIMAHIESNGRASGIVKEAYGATIYNMWRWEGADAVLKKLGSVNTVSFRVRSNKVDNNNTIWIDNLESLKKVTLTLTTAQAFQGVPRIVANGITVVEQYLTQGQSMSYSLTSDITSLYIVIVNNTENSVWTVTLEYE